jgi:hypothetical protein
MRCVIHVICMLYINENAHHDILRVDALPVDDCSPELFLSSQPPPIQDEATVTEHTVALPEPRPSFPLSAAFDDEVSPSIQQDSDKESSVTSSADSENESSIVRVPVPLPLRILPLTPMAVKKRAKIHWATRFFSIA